MLSDQLLSELHKLTRADKLRVVQALVNDLAVEEETFFEPGVEYPIYTPYGNEAAASILFEALKDAEAADRKKE